MSSKPGPASEDHLAVLGRYAGPATLILTSLADGAKHGYALMQDIEDFAGLRISPGTMYEALTRLEERGLVKPLPPEERRRPYELTAAGAAVLRAQLTAQRKAATVGLRRLAERWGS